jgi:hypothetical protein
MISYGVGGYGGEFKAQVMGAFGQILHDPLTVALFVLLLARFHIGLY